MEVFAEVLAGYVTIVTNGGNGNKGQDGAAGRNGPDSLDKVSLIRKNPRIRTPIFSKAGLNVFIYIGCLVRYQAF